MTKSLQKCISCTVKVLLFVGTNFRGSTECIDPWVLEFVVSNTTGNNQWEKLYFVGFLFSWFKWTTKSAKIRKPRFIMISQYVVLTDLLIYFIPNSFSFYLQHICSKVFEFSGWKRNSHLWQANQQTFQWLGNILLGYR